MRSQLPYFVRQQVIPWWNQEILAKAKILIIGAGGIGSHVAMMCCRLGIGKITLVDYDVVETSNLNRQILYGDKDIGRLKVDAAQDALQFHGLSTRIQVQNFDTLEDWQKTCNLIRDSDYVINSLDLPEVKRLLIASACVGLAKPMTYAGTDVLHGAAGMILFQPPSGQPCYECLQATRFSVKPDQWAELLPARVLEMSKINLNDLILERKEYPPAATNEAIAGAVSSITVMEMVKFLHSIVTANRIIIDLLNLTLESFVLEGDQECLICGKKTEELIFSPDGVGFWKTLL